MELSEAIIFLMKIAKEYKIYGDLDNPEFEDIKKIPEAIKTVLQALKNSIPRKKIKDKIKEINNKIKQNEKELRKKNEPVGSGFNSFDDYFKWKSKVINENKLLEKEIKDIQEILEDK